MIMISANLQKNSSQGSTKKKRNISEGREKEKAITPKQRTQKNILIQNLNQNRNLNLNLYLNLSPNLNQNLLPQDRLL